jgi:hypothetical protein
MMLTCQEEPGNTGHAISLGLPPGKDDSDVLGGHAMQVQVDLSTATPPGSDCAQYVYIGAAGYPGPPKLGSAARAIKLGSRSWAAAATGGMSAWRPRQWRDKPSVRASAGLAGESGFCGERPGCHGGG